MPEAKNSEKPVGFECRFATYISPPEGEHTDLHVIKEVAHYADGSTKPQLRFVPNYKRPYWITKKGHRNHKDRKEWELIERVDRFESTQTLLPRGIARALEMEWCKDRNGRLDSRKIMREPYIYGSDILSTAVIKRSYQDKYPELKTPYTVATFDTEKDMVNGTGQITMATMAFGKRVYTAVQKSVVDGILDAEGECRKAFAKYIGRIEKKGEDEKLEYVDYIKKRGIEWEIEFVDAEIDVVIQCLNRAHEWKPDFVAIWNLDFDISLMIEACNRAGVNPADIFSDPSVPNNYKYFRYKQGKKQMTTASGVVKPKKPADQWHTVFTPASFYWIDAMCVYRKLRIAKGEEPSYALDDILDKVLGVRKLNFEEANGLARVDWHIFMQSNHPIEYIVYNVWDCVSMEELDELTTDLRIAMPLASGCSDFCNFHSQPRRVVDALHYFVQTKGRVMGSTSDQMRVDMDDKTVNPDGWIVALPAHLVADNGLQVIEEYPNLRTNIRIQVADLDVAASYPNGGSVFNQSKETTFRELCEIEGVSELLQRMQGFNYATSGHTNAVEVACGLFGLPDMSTMLNAFEGRVAAEEGRETPMLIPSHFLEAVGELEIEYEYDEDDAG